MESRMPGNLHVRFGKRRNETDRRKPTRRVAPTSPWLFEPATIAASMAIDRPQAIDDAPLGAGAQRRMAAERLSWLARNGRSRGPSACGVASPGEESLAAAIAARRSRLAVLWPDHAIKKAARVARQTALQGEDMADVG